MQLFNDTLKIANFNFVLLQDLSQVFLYLSENNLCK